MQMLTQTKQSKLTINLFTTLRINLRLRTMGRLRIAPFFTPTRSSEIAIIEENVRRAALDGAVF
jgi:hypothetical protein